MLLTSSGLLIAPTAIVRTRARWRIKSEKGTW
jgi:hypothetical protein